MTRLGRIILLIMVALMSTSPAFSQKQSDKHAEREQWFREIRQLKHEYIERELKLTDDQKTKFFALYDAMSDELRAQFRAVRKAEKALKEKGAAATEADYENVATLQYELKGKESAIEMKYYKQFKTVLTPSQLVNLKKVEGEFDRFIREQHKERKHHKK